jgi:hypothetical protein
MSDPTTALADTLPGAYDVTTTHRKPAGSRRDRAEGALRRRVEELEAVVDVMAAALTELRRHVQFHAHPVPGCGVCQPTELERATEDTIQFDRHHQSMTGEEL